MGAARHAPKWPAFLRAGPTAWREVLNASKPPRLWNASFRTQVAIHLGILQPDELAQALLHLVNPDKAQVVRLGHWPRFTATQRTPVTEFKEHLTRLLQHIASVYAPHMAVTAALVEQRETAHNSLRTPVCGFSLKPNWFKIGVFQRGKWVTVQKTPIPYQNRYLVGVVGRNHERVPPKMRIQLRKLGFTLQHLG